MKRLALLALLVLAACGSETGVNDDLALAKRRLALVLGGGAAAGGGLPPLSRALFDSIGKPLLKVTLVEKDVTAVLGLVAQNGNAVTWATADNITLSLRDGVIVASRGLVDDLMSASVPSLRELAGGIGVVQRQHFMLQGGEREVMAAFDCSLALKGTESLTLYDIGYSVRHVVETCKGPSATFRNEYWLEAGGKMRQSRQWIGKQVGFVELQLVSR